MYAITRQDIANICDADAATTRDVVARDEVTVAELVEANHRLEGTAQVASAA